jgi:hypothetical protein
MALLNTRRSLSAPTRRVEIKMASEAVMATIQATPASASYLRAPLLIPTETERF